MKILKELFGFNKTNKLSLNNESMNQSNLKSNLAKDIPEELFVDKQPPNLFKEKIGISKQSPIVEILSKRWYSIGYNDGYSAISATKKIVRIQSITSEIIISISKAIELLNNEIEKISLQKILLEQDDDLINIHNQVELKIRGLRAKIEKLEKDIDLMNQRKGTMSKPIHDYIDGFAEGAHDRISKDLLNKELNIF
tara:strand:- start:143 stop:730 length:588 start_codon:yes stop_codon:yes gene_type:complete